MMQTLVCLNIITSSIIFALSIMNYKETHFSSEFNYALLCSINLSLSGIVAVLVLMHY